MRKQLEEITVYPILIPKLKNKIIEKYYHSIAQPGTMVGIIAGQSIGEKQTQSTLNTFHSAGSSHQTVTKGVPRVDEIISLSKKPKQEVSYIYLNHDETLKTVDDVLNIIQPHLVHVTFKDITTKTYEIKKIETRDDLPDWYSYYHFLNDEGIIEKLDTSTLMNEYYVRFYLSKEFMISESVQMSLILKQLKKIEEKENYVFVPSPSDLSIIDVFVLRLQSKSRCQTYT